MRKNVGRMGRVCIPLLVLDLGLDIVDGVGALHLEGDGFTREAVADENLKAAWKNGDSRFYEDLHVFSVRKRGR